MPLHGAGMDCGGDMGLDFGLGGEKKLGAQRQIRGAGAPATSWWKWLWFRLRPKWARSPLT